MKQNDVTITLDKTDALMKAVQDLARKQVLVGIPSNSGSRSDGMTNSTLGYIHEFGSPAQNIPARPFLIPTINKLKDKAIAMLRQAADLTLDRKPGQAKQTLDALGLMAATAVKNNIVAGGDPKFQPLAPSTIARRTAPLRQHGLDYNVSDVKPLIDTAQMLNSINYVVRDKGK